MGRNRSTMRTITQAILFRGAQPALLYETYLNAGKHAESIGGAKVTISDEIGADFSIYGHYIKGKNIDLIKNKLIVQRWRAADWDEDELDSIVSIQLKGQEDGTLLVLVHANIPIKNLLDIKRHWEDFYWKKWKKYFGISVHTIEEGID